MNFSFARGMARATALTQSGDVFQATALIQSLLCPKAPDSTAVHLHDADVIDGDFTLLEPAATPERPTPKTKRAGARTPLAETLRKIAAGGMPAQGPKTAATSPMRQGAQFLTLTHSAAHGSRGYRLYIPANRPQSPMPLIVMLHGCTQTAEDFAAGTGMNEAAEEFGCMIAYPTQPSGANMQKCWNWYRPEDQGRGQGEPALLTGLTRDILNAYPADPARTYIAGLSAGGAAAVLVAAAYPELFGAVGVHSGLPTGGAHDIPSAYAAMRSGIASKPHDTGVPTIVFHGLADTTVHPVNGAAVLNQAVGAMPGLKVKTRKGVSAGGRKYRATTHSHTDGRRLAEYWEIEGAGHAWAGGNAAGSYTDPSGPDATRQMVQFFLQHKKT